MAARRSEAKLIADNVSSIEDIARYSETDPDEHHPWALFLQWFIGRQYNNITPTAKHQSNPFEKLFDDEQIIIGAGYQVRFELKHNKYIVYLSEGPTGNLTSFQIYSNDKNVRRQQFRRLCAKVTSLEALMRDAAIAFDVDMITLCVPLVKKGDPLIIDRIYSKELIQRYPDDNPDVVHPWALLIQWLIGRNYQFELLQEDNDDTDYAQFIDLGDICTLIYFRDNNNSDREVEYKLTVNPTHNTKIKPCTYRLCHPTTSKRRINLRMIRNFIVAIAADAAAH